MRHPVRSADEMICELPAYGWFSNQYGDAPDLTTRSSRPSSLRASPGWLVRGRIVGDCSEGDEFHRNCLFRSLVTGRRGLKVSAARAEDIEKEI